MEDVMVTARMPRGKKEAGNRVLARLGTNASQAISDLYGYLIEKNELPYAPAATKTRTVSKAEIAKALAYIDSFTQTGPYSNMTDEEIKRERMLKRGYLTESDFL